MFICLVPSVVLLYVMMYPKNWQKKQRIFGVNNRPEFKVDKSAKFIDILVGTHKKQGTAILIGILVISTLLLFVPNIWMFIQNPSFPSFAVPQRKHSVSP